MLIFLHVNYDMYHPLLFQQSEEHADICQGVVSWVTHFNQSVFLGNDMPNFKFQRPKKVITNQLPFLR